MRQGSGLKMSRTPWRAAKRIMSQNETINDTVQPAQAAAGRAVSKGA